MSRAHAPSRKARVAVAVIVGASGLAVLGVASCGPGDLGGLTRGRSDGGVDAPAPDVVEVCVHASAPERPAGDDSPSVPDLLFAAEDLRLDTGEAPAGLPRPEGLDLDRTCSCVEPPSCLPPADAGAPVCDGPDGRDNVAGGLLGTLGLIVPVLEPSVITNRIKEGGYSVLVSVQKWNGQPNDPEVVVTLRMSTGMAERVEADGGIVTKPRFDGNDVWEVDPGSIVSGDTLVDQDCNVVGCLGLGNDLRGYVRDGVLVANFETIPFSVTIPKGRLVFPFVNAVLTARITQDGGRYVIAGEIAGRWSTESILAGFYQFRDPITEVPLCQNAETYALFKRTVCSSADLAATAAQDRTGAPCTSLSEAIRFVGSPAKVGKVRSATVLPSECPELQLQDSCP